MQETAWREGGSDPVERAQPRIQASGATSNSLLRVLDVRPRAMEERVQEAKKPEGIWSEK